MTFLSLLFLWSSITIAIPIAIALWNRKKFRREKFGAYFLLKRVQETTHRRIQILQILKLINRVALFLLIVTLFAEPLLKEKKLSTAKEGFSIILDVGRGMQMQGLAENQWQELKDLLSQMPEQVQGSILYASDRCRSAKTNNGKLTATADEWLSDLEVNKIPYINFSTLDRGLTQCLQRIEGVFANKAIFKAFISPFPTTLNEESLTDFDHDLTFVKLNAQPISVPEPLKTRQVVDSEKVQMFFNPSKPRKAVLFRENDREEIGLVEDRVDLVTLEKAFVILEDQDRPLEDPWVGQSIVSIESPSNRHVTLWAQKETPGYLSLLSALRTHPGIKVVRQIGGEPVGSPIIIYGSYPYDQARLGRTWFFVSPSAQSPFQIRDQKRWSPGVHGEDLRKAFRFQTQDGEVFIRKYALFDLDRFEPIESFEDGAPALMESKFVEAKHWVSPFDLEDLTTDLTLEPTFIPYLFRRLDKWLSGERSQGESLDSWEPVWLMKGVVQPVPSVVKELGWPGIYQSEDQFQVVSPVELPKDFYTLKEKAIEAQYVEEDVSLRQQVIKTLSVSVLLELLFCLASAKWGILLLLSGLSIMPTTLSAASVDRQIMLGSYQGVDKDRLLGLSQIVGDVAQLSNLDFAKPQVISVKDFWKQSSVVVSSTNRFGPFSKEDREKIRDYLERGGLLIFDDPLASRDTLFQKSVREEMSKIFPGRSFSPVPKDNVLFRTYYLLSEVAGRRLASPHLEGLELEGRWVAVLSANDLLGANLRSASGDYAYSVIPYGMTQRILSRRLFLNLLMYSVATDYKNDSIHLPFILKKRVK